MARLITDFAESFRAAEHDRDLERRGYHIYHFFDSDILFRVILGYADERNRALLIPSPPRDLTTPAGRRLILSALISTGIATPSRLRALPPHLHEIRLLASRPRRASARERVEVIEHLGLHAMLKELARLAGAERVNSVFQRFMDEGPSIFYGVDLVRGSWESRLGRLLRAGIQARAPFRANIDVIHGEMFAQMSQAVAERGGAARPGAAVAAMRDALALTILGEAIARYRKAPGKTIARFYTETPRILDAWRNNRSFRDLLTYPSADNVSEPPASGLHGIIRSETYYLLRALIPDLAYAPPEGDEQTSLDSAAELLARSAESYSNVVYEGFANTPLAHIESYVDMLTELSSYNSAWRGLMSQGLGGLPSDVRFDLERLHEEDQRLSAELQEEFIKLAQDLVEKTEEVDQFTTLYHHVAEVLGHVNGMLRPGTGVQYVEHFGLRRWGFGDGNVPDNAIRELVDLFEAWQHQGALDVGRGAQAPFAIEVARRVLALRDAADDSLVGLNDDIALLGFLWMVSDYRTVAYWGDLFCYRVARLRETHKRRESIDRLGGAVANMVTAAEARAEFEAAESRRRSARSEEIARRAAQANEFVRTVTARYKLHGFSQSPQAVALTKGYITFHAWQSLGPFTVIGRKARQELDELLWRSFDVVRSVLEETLPTDDLYRFLLNHCVYVGAMLDLGSTEPDVEISLVDRLVQCNRGAWSYRFDDTIGYMYLVRARRAMAKDDLDLASDLLKESRVWFNNIADDIGDRDVATHRAQRQEAALELTRLQAGARDDRARGAPT